METVELTNALITEKATSAMIERDYATNIDSCRTTGIYILRTSDATCENPPGISSWNYGILEVINRGNSTFYQRITTIFGSMVFRWGDMNGWNVWRKVLTETL